MTAVGDRVELVYCSDPWTRLNPGEQGTVQFIDSIGTTHVKWDNGSNLGLIAPIDAWRVVQPKESNDD